MVSPFCVSVQSPKKSEARVCPSLRCSKSSNPQIVLDFARFFRPKKKLCERCAVSRTFDISTQNKRLDGIDARRNARMGPAMSWGWIGDSKGLWRSMWFLLGKWRPFEVYAAYVRFMFPHLWNMCNLPTITLFCALQPSTENMATSYPQWFPEKHRRLKKWPSGKQTKLLPLAAPAACPGVVQTVRCMAQGHPGRSSCLAWPNIHPLWVGECKEVITGLYYHLVGLWPFINIAMV